MTEHESALDILLLIALLCVVVISAPYIMKELQMSEVYARQEIGDKLVTVPHGDANYSFTTVSFNGDEIALAIMSQSLFLSPPKVIDVAGTKFKIEDLDGFAPLSVPYGIGARNAILSWFSSFRGSSKWSTFVGAPNYASEAKFMFMFYAGNMNNRDDDCYATYIYLERASGTSRIGRWYRCAPSGAIV